MNDLFKIRRGRQRSETKVHDTRNRIVATFTAGAFTVRLAGPKRTFVEGKAKVSHAIWVRTYPSPFDGRVNQAWLRRALEANSQGVPDILAIAMQYIRNAPPIHDGGLQVAGDAHYGPLKNGKRQEGSDFNDYLGITWNYPGERFPVDKPEPRQRRCLDCSGFLRMVWGYRNNLPTSRARASVPLCFDTRPDHSAIPRRAYQIYEGAPGVMIAPDNSIRVTGLSQIEVGDLVFFNADKTLPDGDRIDHAGIYMGRDANGRYRFISSRKSTDGPTMSDQGVRGGSALDGNGTYPDTFVAARRI
jgi:cell wall-associated NlpC family hydrolase